MLEEEFRVELMISAKKSKQTEQTLVKSRENKKVVQAKKSQTSNSTWLTWEQHLLHHENLNTELGSIICVFVRLLIYFVKLSSKKSISFFVQCMRWPSFPTLASVKYYPLENLHQFERQKYMLYSLVLIGLFNLHEYHTV